MSTDIATVLFPSDLNYVSNLKVHTIVWDVTRGAPGIVFDNKNCLVQQNVSPKSHKCVFGTEGFTTGSHYWNIKVLEISVDAYIMIGVSKDASVTASTFPGSGTDKGVSYYGNGGHRYFANANAPFGQAFKNGDVVGTLLNMEHKTVTFYLNGQRVGTAIGRDQLTEDLYYPCVALHTLGHSVVSLDVPVGTNASTNGKSSGGPGRGEAVPGQI